MSRFPADGKRPTVNQHQNHGRARSLNSTDQVFLHSSQVQARDVVSLAIGRHHRMLRIIGPRLFAYHNNRHVGVLGRLNSCREAVLVIIVHGTSPGINDVRCWRYLRFDHI